MNANELRIGNYVTDLYYEHFKKVIIVESINEKGINVSATDDNKPYGMHSPILEVEYGFEELKPIPLTEQWHNKFGCFKNGFNAFEYKLQNNLNLFITIIFTGDYVMLRQGETKERDNDLVAVWNNDKTKRDMYVHEFQNIFHSLTGTELTLKSH